MKLVGISLCILFFVGVQSNNNGNDYDYDEIETIPLRRQPNAERDLAYEAHVKTSRQMSEDLRST